MTPDDLDSARHAAASLRASHPHLASIAKIVDSLADEVERRGIAIRIAKQGLKVVEAGDKWADATQGDAAP